MMTKLNSDVQTEKDAKDGQGTGRIKLKVRDLKSKKVSTPDQLTISIKEIPSLYARIVTPEEMQFSRVVAQLNISTPSIVLSSQLNNKLNPTMENQTVKGGTRKDF